VNKVNQPLLAAIHRQQTGPTEPSGQERLAQRNQR
jgi:hypothetical protein